MIATTVINLHRKPTPYYDIYIGQRIRFHPNKYPQSKWGNQFTKRYGSIPTRIQLYAEWIQTQPHLLAALPISFLPLFNSSFPNSHNCILKH